MSVKIPLGNLRRVAQPVATPLDDAETNQRSQWVDSVLLSIKAAAAAAAITPSTASAPDSYPKLVRRKKDADNDNNVIGEKQNDERVRYGAHYMLPLKRQQSQGSSQNEKRFNLVLQPRRVESTFSFSENPKKQAVSRTVSRGQYLTT